MLAALEVAEGLGGLGGRLERERLINKHLRPLNQNRAKVKHILGLSLACV